MAALPPSFSSTTQDMNTDRQTYVTALEYLVLGTQVARDRCVKQLWIEQLGGSCVSCGRLHYLEQLDLNFQDKHPIKQKRSSLDAHYIGLDRQGHEKCRLGKLHVSMQNDYYIQNKALKEFIKKLCPCELRCRRCHGRPHGVESGTCMNINILLSVSTQLSLNVNYTNTLSSDLYF